MQKIALVTGASRGIGRAIGVTLARNGWRVALNYRSQREETEALVASLRAEGCDAIAVYGDVAQKASVQEMVATVQRELGRISLLVNNAGITGSGLFQDIDDKQWERCFSVNVNGTRNCILAVLPEMLREHEGCILNLASIWGLRGASCEVPYACTKAAIVGLTRSLAMELAPSGIRVNAIAPGVIETEMLAEYSQETLADLAEQTPLGRLGTPQDIADAVLFLSSPQAAFITGQILTVDGGFIV